MADFKIKKGYTVPIKGEAPLETHDVAKPPFVGLCPIEFKGVKPKLLVKVNDEVKIGTPLFFDKRNPEMKFVSPGGGRVTAINYGPKRVIEEIVIATDEKEAAEEFAKHGKDAIGKLSRDKVKELLFAGGLWPFIRTRPFDAHPTIDENPKSLFINCMNTAPVASDPNYALKNEGTAFEAGVEAMKRLSDQVHVVTRAENPAAAFKAVQGVNHHSFSGKHPAGLVGTHINHIDPINKGESVWYINAEDVVLVGKFLLEGRYPTERIVAVTGPGATKPGYYRARLGAKVGDIVGSGQDSGEMRYINGNVLNGLAKPADTFLSMHATTISIIPEGKTQHFLGWMAPGFSLPSFTRAYISGLMPGKKFEMDTNLNGGHRAIIQSGQWEQVVALDVQPEFLVKATIAQDIDRMEQLGILECAPEDFALCTYICPSKTDVSGIIAEGLDLMEKEG